MLYKMKTQKYYIRNQKTDYSFDPIENKFYSPSWDIEYTDDKQWLQSFIDNDPERFIGCLIEEVEHGYFIICDRTANNGKPYIAEDLSNTGNPQYAWKFDTEEEAQAVIDYGQWDWAYVDEM